jgi:branched-chain amino acid transport system permease protein
MTVVYAGLSTGAIYALIAIGYNITLVTGGVLNFAFANIVMLGGFIGYWAFTSNDLPVVLGFAAAAAAGALAGAIEERVAIRPLRAGQGAHSELITTVGVATAITGALVLIWGSDPRQVEFAGSGSVLDVLGGRLRVGDLVLLGLALGLAMGFYQWTRRTRHGLASLAQSEDREAAMLRGVNVRAFSLLGFVVAGAIAGLIGPVVATVTTASAFTSLVLAVKGFIALTIGGVGSQTGALTGGLLIGLAEATSNYYLGSSVGNVAVFAVFLVVVMARPAGIFGTRLARAV